MDPDPELRDPDLLAFACNTPPIRDALLRDAARSGRWADLAEVADEAAEVARAAGTFDAGPATVAAVARWMLGQDRGLRELESLRDVDPLAESLLSSGMDPLGAADAWAHAPQLDEHAAHAFDDEANTPASLEVVPDVLAHRDPLVAATDRHGSPRGDDGCRRGEPSRRDRAARRWPPGRDRPRRRSRSPGVGGAPTAVPRLRRRADRSTAGAAGVGCRTSSMSGMWGRARPTAMVAGGGHGGRVRRMAIGVGLAWALPAFEVLAVTCVALATIDITVHRVPDPLLMPAYAAFGGLLLHRRCRWRSMG